MSYHKKKLAINKRNSGRRALAEKNFQEFSDRGVGNDIWMKALSSSHAGNHKQKLHHQQLQQQFVDDDDYSDELKIIEKKGSILDAPVDFAIAIADLSELEAGGAFTKEFAVINERCNTIGSVNMHIFNDRLGFYLLVRNRNVKHPSYARLAMCLELTREKMLKNGIKKIALPRLLCGIQRARYRLSWSIVYAMIHAAFAHTEIEEVVVYH